MPRQTFGDLSIDLPSGWRDRSTLLFLEPEGSGFTRNLTVVQDELAAGQATLSEYVDTQLRRLGANLPELKLLARQAPSATEERLQLGWRDFEGRPLRQVQHFLRNGRQVRVFTGSALEGDFQSFLRTFDAVIATVELA